MNVTTWGSMGVNNDKFPADNHSTASSRFDRWRGAGRGVAHFAAVSPPGSASRFLCGVTLPGDNRLTSSQTGIRS